jgi:hypothetical protein
MCGRYRRGFLQPRGCAAARRHRAGSADRGGRAVAHRRAAELWQNAKMNQYLIHLTINCEVYPISRDVTHEHPRAVHAALGTHGEEELQGYLEDCRTWDTTAATVSAWGRMTAGLSCAGQTDVRPVREPRIGGARA